MTIYSTSGSKKRYTHIARNIYQKHFGPIPKDETGRSYEIHHIDGNRHNNDISNLVAVSIKEHYEIHYSQEDWGACYVIAQRMRVSPEELSELARKHNLRRVAEGTHPWTDKNKQRERAVKRVAEGTHHFLGEPGSKRSKEVQARRINDGTHHLLGGEIQRKTNKSRIENGTHHFLGGEITRKNNMERISNGTHHFLGGEIQKQLVADGKHYFQKPVDDTHPTQFIWVCEHCSATGKGKTNYTRWHGTNCKSYIGK